MLIVIAFSPGAINASNPNRWIADALHPKWNPVRYVDHPFFHPRAVKERLGYFGFYILNGHLTHSLLPYIQTPVSGESSARIREKATKSNYRPLLLSSQ